MWLIANWRSLVAMIATLTICALAFTLNHYRAAYDNAATELALASATITDMQTRQRDVAALDTKYTKELADAKAVNDSLRDDVAAGRKRLLIKANCVRETSTPGSVGNAGTAELAADSRQDYYHLREQLATSDKMVRYLQDYINQQFQK